ncbi:Lrp/AsnC family leucine-responsive transcriptional regulator [Aneurinibacillus soli]|uniref:HTH-type transcriptional regulator LrpC n=1 Tax=Aneurinibacillus soli TaxID=1500254 RepID=A0A0U4WCT1_9BACL|nr:Lrp/AsnC family transcriptional regulator [Aneurinibacillus soli]PYE61429.1 Lrp/AsnC family leucine-responsive transcriptional regulator [Aneurinibacillus soli]BAU26617.1 HTH-type transcriptional regulator LrpC [Aneurinibacillus soli]
MLDAADKAILDLLQKNARMQWREIGEQVHLTGQAVANRIRRMEEAGVITGYAVQIDEKKLGKSITAFVTVFMKSNNHEGFRKFIQSHSKVYFVHRVSGDGCYLIHVCLADMEELQAVLDELLQYANYRVQISVSKMK